MNLEVFLGDNQCSFEILRTPPRKLCGKLGLRAVIMRLSQLLSFHLLFALQTAEARRKSIAGEQARWTTSFLLLFSFNIRNTAFVVVASFSYPI